MLFNRIVITLLAVFSFYFTNHALVQENIDSLLIDFDTYIQYLTDTHPDPYTAFGGRPFFYRDVVKMRTSLVSNPNLDKSILADSLRVLASRLGDGHTIIYTQNKNRDLYAVGHIVQAQDSIFLRSLHKDNQNLLGARINKIAGVEVDRAITSAVGRTSSENRFGPLSGCGVSFRPVDEWKRMFNIPGDSIQLELITVNGDTVDYYMPQVPSSQLNKFDYARIPDEFVFPHGLFEYKLIESPCKAIVFSVPTIAARENFEYCYKNGMDFVSWMRSLYGYLGRQMPADTIEALDGFPAYFERFKEMLDVMKKNKIPHLVIDLRGNSGGWTPIVLPSLMLLYGDNYVKSKFNNQEYDFQRISPLYLEKINITIDNYNHRHGTNLKINDFVFKENRPVPDDSIAFYREEMIDDFLLSEAEKSFLRSLKGKPLYQPERVFVLTDNATFSAAFHYAFFLWRAGAEVVGVTSSQAPNTFMEQTVFTLPYSGIKGSISNYQQLLLPPADPRAKEFTPGIPVNYSTYRKYDLSPDAPIKYLLDLLKNE